MFGNNQHASILTNNQHMFGNAWSSTYVRNHMIGNTCSETHVRK